MTTRTLIAVLTALLIAPAHDSAAQSTYGAVVGTARDASAAVLPGATVTLTEVQTSFVRTTVSDPEGAFEFQNLTLGLYRVDADLAGFQKFSTEPFRVEARQTVRIDARLSVAALSEQVTVRSGAPLINTETPTVAGRVGNRELQQLPFTFRTQNTSPIPAIQAIPEVQRVGEQFSLSGGLPYQTEVSVDGILTTSVRRNGIGAEGINVFPSIESVEEIKVSSVNNTAEYAQLGDITTVSKPGTNQLHGTAFLNFNGTGLNANPNYFNKAVARNQSENSNYGFSAGGPIARSRTFFFGTFERLDISRTQSAAATVPSDAFRQGDLSSIATPLVDPSNGQPFANNRIPSTRINRVATALLQEHIPAPNEGTSIHRYVTDATEVSNQFDARLDQNFSAGHTLFGRLSYKKVDKVSPTTFQSLGPRSEERPNHTLVVSDNFAIRPTLLNEARFGMTRADQSFTTGRRGLDIIAALGLTLLSTNPPDVTGTPSVQIAGYTSFGESQEEPLTQDTWQIADSVTWLKGRHTMKGGFDIKRFNWTSPVNFTGADDFGVFRFNNNIQGGGAGHPFANFLLGIPTDVDQTASGPNVDGVATHYGFFVQDEWRVHNSVTLSLGVRYELRPPFDDREENISNFLRDTPNGDVIVPSRASIDLTAPGFAGSIGTARILAADEAGYPRALRFTDKNNIEPRLGVAWRPGADNRTVVRGGYGIYHARILGQVFNSLTGIHTSDNVTFANVFDAAARTYAIVWPNTYAGDPTRGVLRIGTQNFSTANDPNYKDPMTQQWSLTVERQVGSRQAVRATYSGFHSTDLTMAPDLNQIQPNTTGYANLPLEARPFPNWSRINTRDNGGYQNYHDLVFQLRGDLTRRGVSHTTTYKWASSVDNIEDRGAGQADFQTEINGRTDNRFDADYLRGRTTNIPRHRFVTSLIWNLPVGRGRAFGSAMPAALDAIAGGWAVSTLVQVQSGPYLTAFYSSHCGSGTNCYGSEKADAVGGQDPNDGPKTLAQWFNTGAFSIDAFRDAQGRAVFAGRFGNVEKGAIVGPGAWNVDFAAFKDVRLGERATARFNVFVTNLFNHPNWGRPDTNVTSTTYGQISSLNSIFPLRAIVLGGRLVDQNVSRWHTKLMSRMTVYLVTLLATVFAPWPAEPPVRAQTGPPAVILITLDGARTEEVFGGLDADVFRSTLREKQRLEAQPTYQRFWAESPEARREKLMPFFWGTLMRQHGSIAGNPRRGSSVTLTNTHRFSYPGYSEILLGEAHDDTIKSNDPIRNPYSTVLEEVQSRLKLTKAQVAMFGSWNVFDAIVEHKEGSLTVNTGFERFESTDRGVAELSRLQFETPTPWDSVRHDIYTFQFAMAHLKSAKPRLMYLALGETDDWAHDGRYDRVLESYARTDSYLRDLWTWLQSDPVYRGRTHILITTDHGRGHTPKDWRDHGAKVEGAQDVWIAMISPSMPKRGEWQDAAPLRTNQVAATLAGWMGVNWSALRPAAGVPISAK